MMNVHCKNPFYFFLLTERGIGKTQKMKPSELIVISFKNVCKINKFPYSYFFLHKTSMVNNDRFGLKISAGFKIQ